MTKTTREIEKEMNSVVFITAIIISTIISGFFFLLDVNYQEIQTPKEICHNRTIELENTQITRGNFEELGDLCRNKYYPHLYAVVEVCEWKNQHIKKY